MPLSRRDFLKLTGASLGAGLGLTAFRPLRGLDVPLPRVPRLPEFPEAKYLARNAVGGMLNIMSRPDMYSAVVRPIYEDTTLPWLREVNAENLDLNRINQRWVETPEGYIYSSDLQRCQNIPNQPLTEMPGTMANDKPGFWVEVTVPYVDFVPYNPPVRSPWLKWAVENKQPTRMYYGQIMWCEGILPLDDGRTGYLVSELYGSYGDIFLADGAAFRPITEDEVTPINPDVDPNEKIVKVNITYQYVQCFEGKREVYFCRCSSGVADYATPIGNHLTWRKMVSTHMANGTVSAGYDTPGIGWTTLFAGTGVAIHATFWHNDYGAKRSHGCVNVLPEDAKWIWRWTTPYVPLYPGDMTVGMPGGTMVSVEERLI